MATSMYNLADTVNQHRPTATPRATHNRANVTTQYIAVFHAALLMRERRVHAQGCQFCEIPYVSALCSDKPFRR